MKFKNDYNIMGIKRSATQGELKRAAYDQLATRWTGRPALRWPLSDLMKSRPCAHRSRQVLLQTTTDDPLRARLAVMRR